MRLVLDTSVVVAALRSRTGASAALIVCGLDGHFTMLISVALALEYEATCLLPEHRLATGLAHETHQRYVDTLIGVAKHVTPYFLWRPQLRDPGDEMVLETAVNGRADAIVTFNQRDFGGVPEQFGIALLRPSDALRRIRL